MKPPPIVGTLLHQWDGQDTEISVAAGQAEGTMELRISSAEDGIRAVLVIVLDGEQCSSLAGIFSTAAAVISLYRMQSRRRPPADEQENTHQ